LSFGQPLQSCLCIKSQSSSGLVNRQLINAKQLASMSNLRIVFPDEPN
jgi:hypothetical protein